MRLAKCVTGRYSRICGTSSILSRTKHWSLSNTIRRLLPEGNCHVLPRQVAGCLSLILTQTSATNGLTAFCTADSTSLGSNVEHQRCISISAVSGELLSPGVGSLGVLRAKRSQMAFRATTAMSRSLTVAWTSWVTVARRSIMVSTTLRKPPEAVSRVRLRHMHLVVPGLVAMALTNRQTTAQYHRCTRLLHYLTAAGHRWPEHCPTRTGLLHTD